MIKKNLTLAQGSKAFVMAAFIAISGMYSVQAMQHISPELVASAQEAREKTRTIKTELELAPVLKKLHDQIKTDKNALSKNETARTELKETLSAIQNNISAKSYIKEFFNYADKAVKEISQFVEELENNTIASNALVKFLYKKKNNTPEGNSAKHDEGTVVKTGTVVESKGSWKSWIINKASLALLIGLAIVTFADELSGIGSSSGTPDFSHIPFSTSLNTPPSLGGSWSLNWTKLAEVLTFKES